MPTVSKRDVTDHLLARAELERLRSLQPEQLLIRIEQLERDLRDLMNRMYELEYRREP